MPWARTTAIRTRVGRVLGGAERLAATRRGAVLLLFAAIAVYAFESIGWPLQPGRDFGVYLRFYVQLGQDDPVFPWAMLSRTPVAPVVMGLLLDAGGGLLAEIFMAVLFAASVLAWSAAARIVGGARAAVLVAVALLVFPAYGGLFHQLSSDALYAAGFASWAFLVARAVRRPTVAACAGAGAGVALLALTRPVNQVLVLVAALVLLVPGRWLTRAARAAAFAAAALVPLLSWATVNDARYGDFTVARGGQASIPLFRAFVTDKIMSPDNGPASRRLAAAVRADLLRREPYRSYDIDLHEFFTLGSPRMQEDLISLSDRVFGWNTDYSVLGRAAREAVRRHRRTYVRHVAASLWQELSRPAFVPGPTPSGGGGSAGPATPPPTVTVEGKKLPEPSEGEPIPAAHQGAYTSTPDGHIREVWTSPTAHEIVFDDPRDKLRYDHLNERLNELGSRLPTRWESAWLHLQMNHASKLYPPLWLWFVVGAIGLAYRRPAGWRAPVILVAGALLMLLFTVLGVYAVPDYAVPVAPSFVLLAAVGLLGQRQAPVPSRP
jgi:hypothetical protein